jgi:hypothetical protein
MKQRQVYILLVYGDTFRTLKNFLVSDSRL